MEIFIDEGGQFTQANGWGVVSALVLPDRETGPTRRKLAYLTRDWPRAPAGELKGGSLNQGHLEALVDLLVARSALLHAVAIDMANENDDGLKLHKQQQCERLTMFLTQEHHGDLVAKVWELRRTLEKMPTQLYVQSVLMNELTATTIQLATLYFAQRRPQELGSFRWTIDAKDPLRITTQERWWRDTLGPLQESRSRIKPLNRVNDPDFNYKYFDKSYELRAKTWHADKPREMVIGQDIGKILLTKMSFVDSRSNILIQATDILTNFIRRLLTGQVTDSQTARTLGRLQIRQSMAKGINQSLHILTLTTEGRRERSHLAPALRQMAAAGRSMIFRKREGE